MPHVYTEHGMAMLSAVLKSDIAMEIGIRIIDSFVAIRHFFSSNQELYLRKLKTNMILLFMKKHLKNTRKAENKIVQLTNFGKRLKYEIYGRGNAEI